jgi:hypothetical protein
MAQTYFRKIGWHRKQMVAVLMLGNKMIAATNQLKTHPASRSLGNRIHCELAVLRHLHPSETGGTMYIYREKHSGFSALARPCQECFALLRQHKIKKVYYSTDMGWAKERIY